MVIPLLYPHWVEAPRDDNQIQPITDCHVLAVGPPACRDSRGESPQRLASTRPVMMLSEVGVMQLLLHPELYLQSGNDSTPRWEVYECLPGSSKLLWFAKAWIVAHGAYIPRDSMETARVRLRVLQESSSLFHQWLSLLPKQISRFCIMRMTTVSKYLLESSDIELNRLVVDVDISKGLYIRIDRR